MNLNKCVLSFINTVSALLDRKLCDVTDIEICDTGYKTGNEPPKEGWREYDMGVPLTGDDAHFWLRTSIHTPTVSENEYLILRTKTGREGMWDATNPQGLLYLNGKMVQGLDTNHTDAYLDADTEYTVHNYFHMGTYSGGAVQCKMAVYAVNKDVEHLYYDIKIPYDACQMLDEGSEEYVRMMSVLVDAVRLVDFREPHSERFHQSVKAAIDFMEKEFYAKLCTSVGKPVVHCIGHTHIDVEWKWARAQTREKIQRSFSTAKSLMDRYPEYKFMLSQPELYRYLKEEAPEKYEELKQLVKEGRWEPEGAMYLEPDCNLTSGESLVRQLIFGKRFFREEFEIESRALFLPDVFGYSAALPQILKKSGVDYFITSKISWNDTNTMPMDLFYWEGIDGTEIFTSFMTAQDFGGIPGKGGKNRTTYNGLLNSSYVKGTWDRFQQKEYTDHVYMTFGHGDGGGGPTKEMLETQRRTARGIPSLPVTEMDMLIPYLQKVKDEFDSNCDRTARTPKWVGELYLEFHRGTYTATHVANTDTLYNVSAETMIGIAAKNTLTEKGMTGWTTTETGYPMPTALAKYGFTPEIAADADAKTSLVGYQATAANNNKFNLRLVSVIDIAETEALTDYDAVGFRVVASYANGETAVVLTKDYDTTKVYKAITGNTEDTDNESTNYTAEALGGDAIFVLACENIPANKGDITFVVTTYYVKGEATVEGATEVFQVDPENDIPETELSKEAA